MDNPRSHYDAHRRSGNQGASGANPAYSTSAAPDSEYRRHCTCERRAPMVETTHNAGEANALIKRRCPCDRYWRFIPRREAN